jgi:hypothetical protein
MKSPCFSSREPPLDNAITSPLEATTMPELSSATASVDKANPATNTTLEIILIFNFMFIQTLLLLLCQPVYRNYNPTYERLVKPRPPCSVIPGQQSAETVENIIPGLARESVRADILSITLMIAQKGVNAMGGGYPLPTWFRR